MRYIIGYTVSRVYHIEVEYVVVYKVEISTIMTQGVKHTNESINELLAKDGWELVEDYNPKNKNIFIKNENYFNGFTCSIWLSSWLRGARPGFVNIVDQEAFMRAETQNEGWDLLRIEQDENSKKFLVLQHPNKFNGNICRVQLQSWRNGNRPEVVSLVDQKSYFIEELAKEGWVLVGEYKDITTTTFIKNPNVFNGHLCEFSFGAWRSGARPILSSLVDQDKYIEALLNAEGWELVEIKRTGARKDLYIRNQEYFDGGLCCINWNSWRNGHRPAVHSLVDQSGYIEKELSSEGWYLAEHYKNAQTRIIIKHDTKLNGFPCKINIRTWREGGRPNFQNVVNKTEYVRTELEKEGWELLSECKGSRSEILMRHPIESSGLTVKFRFCYWELGKRPINKRNLSDNTELYKKELTKEGWNLISVDRSGSQPYVIIQNESFFNGHKCSIRWSNWNSGHRPIIKNLIDPDLFIQEELSKEGWTLWNNYTRAIDPLIITNPKKMRGHKCISTWQRWSIGRRPDMTSLVDKTAYVLDVMNELGFEPVDKNWSYTKNTTRFLIREILTGKESMISYAQIGAGSLPGTPKRIIRNRINDFLRKRKAKKSFSITENASSKFWVELEMKFPYIPVGYHIDHIIPLSYGGETWEQMEIVNNVRNLRLLPAKENIQRKNKLKTSELDEYNLWDLYAQVENPMGYQIIEDRYDLAN